MYNEELILESQSKIKKTCIHIFLVFGFGIIILTLPIIILNPEPESNLAEAALWCTVAAFLILAATLLALVFKVLIEFGRLNALHQENTLRKIIRQELDHAQKGDE